MSAILLHQDYENTVTCVSNIFIDRYMTEANGEFVKVYLYLLRCMSNHAQNCTICGIADHFNHTEKDVIRALKYWEKVNLLRLEYQKDKSICGIHLLAPKKPAAEEPDSTETSGKQLPPEPVSDSGTAASSSAKSSKRTNKETGTSGMAAFSNQDSAGERILSSRTVITAPSRKEYTLEEIKQFQKNDSISELFFIIETYLKHPLSSTDINTILYWYDALHFPSELIIYLVEYCISKGHSSMRYMDKVAMGWKDSGITTVDQAKENAAIHSQAYYSVMKALGITGRSLVDGEAALIQKWTKEYSFDLSIILEACKRTMTATHQPSFEYTDSILTNWHKNQVHTFEDIKALDAAYNKNKKPFVPSKEGAKHNKFNNFNQRDYDYDQLEKMLLTTSVQ